MGREITVGTLKKMLDGLSDDLPIVILGGRQRVVRAEVVYQATFADFDYCETKTDEKPVALGLTVVDR